MATHESEETLVGDNTTNTGVLTNQPTSIRNFKRTKPRWSYHEKRALVSALNKFGHHDIEKIASFLPHKSEKSILLYLNKCRKSAVNKFKQRTSVDIEQSLSVIHPWTSFMNMFLTANPKVHSYLIAYILPVIEKYGNHPPPDMCGGVDFRSAYRTLFNSLIQEEFPHELNAETFSMMFASLNQLADDVINSEPNTENVLRKCLKRCVSEEVSMKKDAAENQTLHLPEVNMLSLTSEELDLLCKSDM